MNDIAHYINGSVVSGTSSRTQPVYDPATGDSEKNVVLASTADVDTAVAAAKAAWPMLVENTGTTTRPCSGSIQVDTVGAIR